MSIMMIMLIIIVIIVMSISMHLVNTHIIVIK